MDTLDLAYRAYREYRRLTENDSNSRAFRRLLKSGGNEYIEVDSYTCLIEEDWIIAIEEALPYIMNAIAEDRQFVRSDGETTPIEKIKEVKKEAVVDLSKHSNYITHLPEPGQPVVPDKLLQAHKETEYGVYENRFLYTLLDYLHDFLAIRLNEILEASGKYAGKASLNRSIKSPNRKLNCTITFSDDRKNDPIARSHNSSSEAIGRLMDCLNTTEMLLGMTLMKEVSKYPKVPLPVVKTNVFIYNTNFRESLSFFDYLQNYSKKGYTIKKSTKKIDPLTSEIADDLCELVFLLDFLSYEHGNAIYESLEKEYEAENRRRKAIEDEKVLSEIRRLNRKVKESGLSYEQYCALLYKGQGILERKLSEQASQLAQIEKENAKKIRSIREEEARKVEGILAENDKKIAELEDSHKKAIGELEEEKRQWKQEEENRKKALEDELEGIRQENLKELEQKKKEFSDEVDKFNDEKREHLAEMAKLEKENALLRAELTGVRAKAGLQPPAEDFTSREKFLQLEEEKEAFDRFFGKAWKATKKRIRKEAFAQKPEKKRKGEKDEA